MTKLKKTLLWMGIIAGTVIGLTMIFIIFLFFSAGSQLERKLAAIREAGDPVHLADLARKPIPPEKNGATYLLQAKDDMEKVVNAVCDLQSFQQWQYDPADMKKIKEALAAHSDIYPLLQQAAACPDFDSYADYKLPPSKFLKKNLNDGISAVFRYAARYLAARTQLLIYEGNRDEAMRTVILQLQLSRQLEREPLLIVHYLVDINLKGIALECANEILQSGSIDDQMRIALDAELSNHGSNDIFRQTLKNELAYSIDSSKEQSGGTPIISNQWQLSVLNIFERFIEISSLPDAEKALNECSKLDNEYAKPRSIFSVLNLPSQMLIGSFTSLPIPTFRIKAMLRSIRIINALQKKASADNGKIPTMAELGLPVEVGIDPFNGKAMIIKKLPEGWLVYSVGENFKDDGGKVDEENSKPLDVGFGPKISKPESEEKESAEENTQSPEETIDNSEGR
jgi:hypothetical protein